jgi:antitoxin MazE
MRTRVQKWGNSLALRIPRSFAVEIGLSENLAVDPCVADGRLVVQPQCERPLCLADL